MSDYRGHNLVFVVGSPRSGTTWLQRLLACHPLIRTGRDSELFDNYIGPQLRAWRRALDDVKGRGVGLACYLRETEFLPLLRGYTEELLAPIVGGLAPGVLFLDKTPGHALYLPEIRELLPEARIIHVLRDGRDVVASLLAVARAWGAAWGPSDASAAARVWIDHVEAVRAAAPALAADAFIETRYEDLHARTGAVLRRLANFLGLPWSVADIERAVADNSPDKARAGMRTLDVAGEIAARFGERPPAPDGFVRRAEPGGWKHDLTRGEKLQVWREAHAMLSLAGYRWSVPW